MQNITVLELLLKVHGWQGGTIWQAFRELKPEHKQTIKDLAFLMILFILLKLNRHYIVIYWSL
ncbi:hypothetical protein [Aeromonas phage 4L372D]|uniref:Uncharacterized protein n=1 Tax=Aeromonas phage 4L372D TaxID=2588518 RepID=A0A5B9N6R6_9CAUD|nr:hypothetical protein HWC27_gp001 [Aeromonas phage 4L372D]QEG08465.1 hypothetical protein [Aeromonas phage 4L372D]